MNILVINAGSSSLKYQLMNPDTGDVTAKGLCERIGLDGRLTHKVPASGKKYEKDIPMPTHKEAIEAVMSIPRLHPPRPAAQSRQPHGH